MALLNVSTVTIAILQMLQADAALRLLLPDGVFFAEARPGSTRFVIVSLVSSVEAPMFGGPAYKDTVYLVEARALTTAASSTDVENAFARITTLLTDAELTMPELRRDAHAIRGRTRDGRSRRHRSVDSLEPLRRPSARDGRAARRANTTPERTRYGSN